MGRGLSVGILLLFFSAGCTKTVTVPAVNRNGATVNGPTPAAYCTGPMGIAGATVAVTGNAIYQVRPLLVNGLGSLAQSKNGANDHPIRFAEVRIRNAAGTLIQCTETDGTGAFSFLLPAGSADYTIAINSRAKNVNEIINVFNAPESNTLYSVGGTFDPLNTGLLNPTIANDLELVATADNPTVVSGAFNILDKIILANEFLRAKTAGCALMGCTPFTVAHSVSVYWEAGFNPGEYFGPGSGLSFYLPGYYRLFILGGVSGNIDSADTDHFDNSVVLHEYGHFLEDSVFGSDSQGGSHDGNGVIDPRLAWSEGWGNFFQSAVQSSLVYQDTVGNSNGSTYNGFKVGLENMPASAGLPNEYDYTENFGEGIFREFSVARMLHDALDDTVAESENWAPEGIKFDDVKDSFGTLWAALTVNSNFGFSSPNSTFRNAGQLHAAVNLLAGAPDNWSNMRGVERHIANTSEYGQYIRTGLAPCADFTITPSTVTGDSGSFGTSHLLLNNDFYHIKVTGSGGKISLIYQDFDGGGTLTDLDIYVYNTTARFGNSTDWYTYSADDPFDPDPTPDVTQPITEAPTRSLKAGHYLVNVFTYTGGPLGGKVNYKLYLGSDQLCPANLPN